MKKSKNKKVCISLRDRLHKEGIKEAKKRDISFSKLCRIGLIKEIEQSKNLGPRKD